MNYPLALPLLLGYHFSVHQNPVEVTKPGSSETILPTPIHLKGDTCEHGHRNDG